MTRLQLGWMLLPGISAPPLSGSLLMLLAGIAWGMYSLRGRGASVPVGATAGNFLRTLPAVVLSLILCSTRLRWDSRGVGYAVLSGAITSGLGYIAWYAALRGMSATQAAVVQLSVPVLAAFAGIALLGESFTTRLAVASAAILGGIALAMGRARRACSSGICPPLQRLAAPTAILRSLLRFRPHI